MGRSQQNLRLISEKKNIPFLFLLVSFPCNGGVGSETAEPGPQVGSTMQAWGKVGRGDGWLINGYERMSMREPEDVYI